MKKVASFAVFLFFSRLLGGVVSALTLPPELSPNTQAQELYQSAGNFFAARDYSHAASQYQEFLDHYGDAPGALEAMMMLAESLDLEGVAQLAGDPKFATKTLKQAEKAYDKVAGHAPSGDYLAESARFRLGELAFNLGKYDEAIASMESLTGAYPLGSLRGEARILEAQALMSEKKFSQAEKILELMLADQPAYKNDPRLQLARGIALFETGNSSGALSSLEGLNTPAAKLYAARADMNLGRPLIAVENFKALLAMNPDGPYVESSRYLVGEAFFEARDYTSALQIFDQFLLDYPRSALRPAATYKTGLCRYQLKDYMAARGSFESVEQLSPLSEFAELSLYMLGESYLKEENFTKAGFDYSDLASTYSDPLAGTAEFKLAWSQYKRGQYPEASVSLNYLIDHEASHSLVPAAAYLEGNVLSHQEKYRKAARSYQRALDFLSSNSYPDKAILWNPALALLSRSYLASGEFGKLISGYQYALKSAGPAQNPWRAAALLYIAEGYYRKGLYDPSLAIDREIERTYPETPESSVAKDGIAWCLFKQGHYARSYQEREKLGEMEHAPSIAPSKTVFVDENPGAELFIDNQYEESADLFNQKKFSKALDGFESFEKDHPQDARAARAALEEGWCYYRLDYYGDAVKNWERVEATYSSSPAAQEAAWAVADTYFRAAQYDKAVAAYQHILQAYPDDSASWRARLRIAESYYNAKNITQAISAFKDLLGSAPEGAESGEVLDYLTQLLYQPESKEAALEALKSAALTRPGTSIAAEAQLRVGLYLFETGDYSAAVQYLEEAVPNLSRDKDIRDAQYDLAESYYNLKRNEDAERAYRRFTENYPDDPHFEAALFRMGTSAFNLKRFERAASAFHELAEDHPKSHFAALALYNAALSYRKLGNWEAAALALKNYVSRYPDQAKNSNASLELASVYEEERNYAKSIQELGAQRDALKTNDPLRPELSLRIAKDYESLGNAADSIKAYQEAIESPLRDNSYRLNALADLGRYYESARQWAKAAKTYDELAASSSDPSWKLPAKARAQAAREKMSKTASADTADAGVQKSSEPSTGESK